MQHQKGGTQDLVLTIDIYLLVPRILTGSSAYNSREKSKSMTVHSSDIIANDASFANTLPNVEPHHHFSGHQPIPEGILHRKKRCDYELLLQMMHVPFVVGLVEDVNHIFIS